MIRKVVQRSKDRLANLRSRIVLSRPLLWWSWIRTWRSLPVAPWLSAAHYFKLRSYRQAARYYREGLRRYPDHKAFNCAQLDYAYCLFRCGDWKRARQELEVQLQRPNALRDAYLLLAKIYITISQPLQAVLVMKACKRHYRNDFEVTIRFVEAVVAADAPAPYRAEAGAALSYFNVNLDLNHPDRVRLDTASASLELVDGATREGYQLLARVMATGQAPFEAVLLWGECMLNRGRILLARRQFERCLQTAAEDPRPLALLAKTYLQEKGPGRDDWALQLALRSNQYSFWENPEHLDILAKAYEQTGDTTSALLITERIKSQLLHAQVNFSTLHSVSVQVERLRALASASGSGRNLV